MKILLTKNDSALLDSKGISETQIEEQLKLFASGFPLPEITASASVEKGITVISKDEQLDCINAWDEYLLKNRKIVKFVPASGAASRMFKNIYEFIDSKRDKPSTPFEENFFGNIHNFAFFDTLDKACAAYNTTASECLKEGNYQTLAAALLENKGMGYGQLPKGLLLFHSYHGYKRTAAEEHLAEGAMYAKNAAGEVHLHFTVSPEHEQLFKTHIEQKQETYENRFSVKYNITFSCQKTSTDTIAATMDNLPFRDNKDNLVFRPGGHGALIQNLNDIDADIVFVKNIDNVTPDSLKYATVVYKKTLAGLLVTTQQKIFDYLRLIDSGKYNHRQVEEIIHFLHNRLCTRKNDIKHLEDAELILYLKEKLHRPLRICGMVRNDSEPGGGPFLVVAPDGTIAPQILESSQINLDNPQQKALFEQGTHFNPVDIVCALRDHRGNKYNLPDYVDHGAGFISIKSKDGRELKALELPGLWNGAMSNWNTIFVEVPIETFTPVKTVNDLLRREHQ
jgi:hypothetical protein